MEKNKTEKVTRPDYCQYLSVSQTNCTLTNFAEHCEKFSHDTINRYLAGDKITPDLVWENVKGQIIQAPDGYVIFDDTVNEVIVCVKGNQKILPDDCRNTCEQRLPRSEYTEPVIKERNRIESRKVTVFEDIIITDKKIVSNPEEFCKTIRNHWGIENRNHYVKDVSMNEDKSGIRNNPDIFSRLKSFALNILRVNKVKNIASELFYNCVSFGNILSYEGIKEN